MPEPTARDVGEFELIAAITTRLGSSAAVVLGPGDDAAVVAIPDGRVVATTDVLVEGVHFRRDWSSAYDVGRKAAAANLADVAAMGGTATALLVGLAAPADLPLSWALGLADGLRDEAALVGAVVVGGDTVSAAQLVVAVTALGSLDGRAPVTRAGAQVGDQVVLAGRLGWSSAGLRLLQAGITEGPARRRSPPSLPAVRLRSGSSRWPARQRCAMSATGWSPTSATSAGPAGSGSTCRRRRSPMRQCPCGRPDRW